MDQTPSFKFNLNQQKIILGYNKVTIFIVISLYLGFLIILSILPLITLSQLFHLNYYKNFKNMGIFGLAICNFGLVFNTLYAISVCLANYKEYINYKFQFIILNIISFNVINVISNIIIYSYETKVSDFFLPI